MTRASRVPLGHAVKEWKSVGDKDIDGNTIAKGEEGFYYLWHRGLQMLGGQELIGAEPSGQEKTSFKKTRAQEETSTDETRGRKGTPANRTRGS